MAFSFNILRQGYTIFYIYLLFWDKDILYSIFIYYSETRIYYILYLFIILRQGYTIFYIYLLFWDKDVLYSIFI